MKVLQPYQLTQTVEFMSASVAGILMRCSSDQLSTTMLCYHKCRLMLVDHIAV